MKASDELFQLIKSLNKTEKRYFKLLASFHKGDKKYLKLFDAIGKQTEYDEKKLMLRFKEERFTNQFWGAKNYLYNLILKSMDAYHYSMNAELKRGLHQIEFLFDKELFSQCEKIIKKLKKVAVKQELYPVLFEVFKWEHRIFIAQGYDGQDEQYFLERFDELFQFIDAYKNNNEYHLQSILMDIKVNREGGHLRTSPILKEIQTVIEHPLLKAEEKALSYTAKYYFYYCHLTYFAIKNDYTNAYIYAQKQVKLTEEYLYLRTETPKFYIHTLRTLCMYQFFLKRYNEALVTIDKLRKFAEPFCAKSEQIKNELFYWRTNEELTIYTATGEFNKGIKLITAIQEELNKLNIKALNRDDIILLNYTIAVVYFGGGNYTAANVYLNKILNTRIDIRNDVQCFAWLLSLMVHFEMGKQDLLEYRVKSAQRFLYTRERLYKVENIILEFIRKEVPKINSDKELLPAFTNLKMEIEEATKDPFERKALDYFDFISWLESKIENRKFAEVVREKTEKEF